MCTAILLLLVCEIPSDILQHSMYGYTANQSLELELSRDEKRAITKVIRAYRADKDLDAFRRDVEHIVGDRRTRRHNQETVQTLFARGWPVAAFDWTGSKLTKKERKTLTRITFPQELLEEIQAKKIQTQAEVYKGIVESSLVESMLGKPFAFSGTLAEMAVFHAGVKDVEPVRLLRTIAVQTELDCTISQVETIQMLANRYRRNRILDLETDDEDFVEPLEINKKSLAASEAMKDCASILNDGQTKRLKQLVTQRYLISGEYNRAARFWGIELAESGTKEDDLYSQRVVAVSPELINVERTMRVKWMAEQVSEVVGHAKVRHMIGKPSIYVSYFGIKPLLDSTAMQELLAQPTRVNPRRRDR